MTTHPGAKIFISSTVDDFRDARSTLSSALEFAGFQPVLSENKGFPADPSLSPHAACLELLEDCQVVVGIIGRRYGGALHRGWGKYPYTGCTATEAEIIHAYRCNKRLFVYVLSDVFEHFRRFSAPRWERQETNAAEASGYEDFSGTMRLLGRISNLSYANADQPSGASAHPQPSTTSAWEGRGSRPESYTWIVPFHHAVEILQDLRGRLIGDLMRAWKKFQSAEEDRAAQLAVQMILKNPPANLEEEAITALKSPLGQELCDAIGLRVKIEERMRMAEKDAESNLIQEAQSRLRELQVEWNGGRERENDLKRQFLLKVLVPELMKCPEWAASAQGHDSLKRLWELAERESLRRSGG